MTFTHIIFDFDGVVADTESVFAEFDCALLTEVLSHAGLKQDLTSQYIRALAGNNDVSKLRIIAKKYGFDPLPYQDAFVEKRSRLRKTLFKEQQVPFGKNLKPVLQRLGNNKALATNKLAAKLIPDLENMGATKLFDVIVTPDPPLRKKPEPDIILEAMKRINAPPKTTAYIGDLESDIQAAKAAGVAPIGFVIEGAQENPMRKEALLQAGATRVIDDFAQLGL